MAHDRPIALSLAGALMVIAAIGYATAAIGGFVSGGFYPTILGGTTRVDGMVLLIGLAPLVPIAALLSREIFLERSFRAILVGAAFWLVIATIDVAILGGIQVALSVAVSGLPALLLVLAERGRFADIRSRA